MKSNTKKIAKYVDTLASEGFKIRIHSNKNVLGTHFTLILPHGEGEDQIFLYGIQSLARGIKLKHKKEARVTKPEPTKKVSKPARKKKVSKLKAKPKKVSKPIRQKIIDTQKQKVAGKRKAKSIQKKRTKRSKTMDAKKTAKRTLTSTSKNVEKWTKKPGRYDIFEIDTRGFGR